MKTFVQTLLAVLVLAAGEHALAQQAPPAEDGPAAGSREARSVGAQSLGRRLGWQTELGGAVIANPEFQGGSAYRIRPVPYFDVRYVDRQGTKLFANVPQGIGGYFLRRRESSGRSLAMGLSVAPGFANRDPEDFPGLDTFGTGLEARALLDYGGRNWGAQARLSQGVAGGHGGFYGDLGVSWRRRLGRGTILAIGPNLRVGNASYMSALYSVTASEAEATGLNPYDAGAGLDSVALQGVLGMPLGGRWRFTTVARFSWLQDEARSSSLTDTSTQAFVLTAVTRQF